jgi:hypothetical protein
MYPLTVVILALLLQTTAILRQLHLFLFEKLQFGGDDINDPIQEASCSTYPDARLIFADSCRRGNVRVLGSLVGLF